MANAVWPASLPQSPLHDGLTEAADWATIRSQVDVGQAKHRRRYTAEVAVWTMAVLLDSTQIGTFDGFFESTLQFGSLPFDWTNPRTGSAATFRFRRRPTYRRIGNHWRVQMVLEELP